MLLQAGLGAATGRGRPAPRQRGRDPESGRTGPASGATTRHWPDARSTAPLARAARPGSGCRLVARRRVGPWCAGPRPGRASGRGALPCPETPIQEARHAGGLQHLVEPGQRDELVLVAAARPTAAAPQKLAPDGRHRQGVGGVGVAFGVVPDLLVGPSAGSLHPGRQPVDQDRLAGSGHLPRRSRRSSRVVMNVPSGWQYPSVASPPSSRSMLSPTSVLEIPTIRPARRYDNPSNTTAATASSGPPGQRWVAADPGGRGGSRWARRLASQAKTSAGSDERGQDDKGTRPPRKG
jgi:hypothetical protein